MSTSTNQPGFSQSKTGQIIKHRLDNNRDLKVIITARSASTGLGKTTLAIHLARYADSKEWSAEEKGHVDIGDYVNKYIQVHRGASLVADEIEHGADSRRWMSSENVDLSHAWAQLRYRNVTTFATLPTTEMLDNRLLTLSDLWINVVRKGVALPYYLWINDFTGELNRKPLKVGGQREILHFPDLAGDEDYETMQEKKDTIVRSEAKKRFDYDEVEKMVENAKKEAEQAKRNELIKKFYGQTDLTQPEVGDIVGIDQASVSRIVSSG